MFTLKKFLLSLSLALPMMLMAETVYILDYPLPGTGRGYTAVPSSEDATGGALGTITVTYGGTLSLRTSGVRMGASDAATAITLTLPTGQAFANGDKIQIIWDSQTTNETGIKLTAGSNTISFTATNLGSGVEQENEFVVGEAEGQFNIAGQATVALQRIGAKSVDIKRIIIIGDSEHREPGPGPDPEDTPTWTTMTQSTVWDWTKAAAEAGAEKITLDPSQEVLLATVEGITKDTTVFDARAFMIKGENALRNGNACQFQSLRLKVAEDGILKVKFCNVGSSDSKGLRTISVNATPYTETSTGTEDYIEASISVQAGEVAITGYRPADQSLQAIRVLRIEYVKGGTPTSLNNATDASQILCVYTIDGNPVETTDLNALTEGVFIVKTTQGSYKIKK